MKIYKEGRDIYGHCWIEGDGIWFWVCVCDGQSKYGPYSTLEDAMEEFNHWCHC